MLNICKFCELREKTGEVGEAWFFKSKTEKPQIVFNNSSEDGFMYIKYCPVCGRDVEKAWMYEKELIDLMS